jgi:hypothetical protein
MNSSEARRSRDADAFFNARGSEEVRKRGSEEAGKSAFPLFCFLPIPYCLLLTAFLAFLAFPAFLAFLARPAFPALFMLQNSF